MRDLGADLAGSKLYFCFSYLEVLGLGVGVRLNLTWKI